MREKIQIKVNSGTKHPSSVAVESLRAPVAGLPAGELAWCDACKHFVARKYAARTMGKFYHLECLKRMGVI